jgi:hypothetical protein
MAFDPTSQRILMVGGEDMTNVPLSGTRSYDGVSWSTVRRDGRLLERSPAAAYDSALQRIVAVTDSPWPNTYGGWTWQSSGVDLSRDFQDWFVPETGAAMAYDPVRQRVVLFGGRSRRWGLHGTCFEWSGQAWQQVASGPPARQMHAMAYGPVNNAVLLFGGYSATFAVLNDTWLFNGTWSQQQPATNPPPRTNTAIATDPVRRRIVMFGGRNASTTHGDTWEWDGTDWTLRTPVVAPSPRQWSAMAFDPTRGSVVLFGGWVPPAGSAGDTWVWDGVAWTNLGVSYLQRWEHAMVYAEDRQALVVLGGSSPSGTSTLVADGVQLSLAGAETSRIGSPCGTASLGGDTPYAGNASHRVEVVGTPANAPCLVALSLASTPQPVGTCTWYLAGPSDVWFGLANSYGFAGRPTAIPLGVVLHGMQVFAQAAVLDPNGPLGGVALTDARRLTIGV